MTVATTNYFTLETIEPRFLSGTNCRKIVIRFAPRDSRRFSVVDPQGHASYYWTLSEAFQQANDLARDFDFDKPR